MRTLRQTIEGMTLAYDPHVASNLEGIIQFEVSGAEPGAYYLRIEDGCCTFHLGRAARPSLTIATPSDVWLRISAGELSGRDALLDGLYQASGEAHFLMSLDRLFPPRPAAAILAHAPLGGLYNQPRQARVQGIRNHAPAPLCQGAGGIDSAQVAEQLLARGDRGLRRAVEPLESVEAESHRLHLKGGL